VHHNEHERVTLLLTGFFALATLGRIT